ncbi:25130_t:CDS:2, partial [Gigaspora margarita]
SVKKTSGQKRRLDYKQIRNNRQKIENYELKMDCKKRLRAQIKYIKALIKDKKYRKKVTNEKERKTLSDIINEIDKKRDQKAKFWIKISESSKEKQKTFNQYSFYRTQT